MDKLVRLLFWSAVTIGLIVGVARLGFLRWWRVPVDDPVLEASVAPTLFGGDLVLLWRFTPPRFGSLVLCPEPDEVDSWIVGRIVGEAGDEVVVDGDDVFVNDQKAGTETACAEPIFVVEEPNSGSEVEQRCDVEALGGVTHMRGGTLDHRVRRPKVTVTVGEGKLFLLSDNRLYPYDSRHYGTVDAHTCRESVFFRLVSHRGYLDARRRFTYIR